MNPARTTGQWDVVAITTTCRDSEQYGGIMATRPATGTVRADLETIYSRLNVSSRTAAVTRAFSDQVA